MSFLNGLRGMWNHKPQSREEWIIPESDSELDNYLKPDSGLVIIYKHSFSCGVSIFAKSRLEDSIDEINKCADCIFIDVKLNRYLSNKIAEKTGVRHESPQLLLLNNGEIFWHGSHGSVQVHPIIESIEEITGTRILG